MKNNEFSKYHPIVNFIYYGGVIVFSMIFNNPICLITAFIAAVTYSIIVKGNKGFKFTLCFAIPMMIGIIIVNPLFSHKGITILGYLNNKPITLESIIYGVASAFMLVTLIIWFSTYEKIITSDKFIYLFGKTIPSISLIISMTLSFIPRFKERLYIIEKGQKNLGRDINEGNNKIEKIKIGCRSISILTTWALENGVQTADSMRSRGYGLKDRSSFSLYKFEKRDKISLIYLIFLIGILIGGYLKGILKMDYYPSLYMQEINIFSIGIFIAYGMLVFFPVFIEIKESIRWHLLKSKI